MTLVALFVAGFHFAWHAAADHRAIVASIPECPDLVDRAGELRDRISQDDRTARGFFAAAAAYARLAQLYHANGLFDEALACYDGLQRLQPREPRWPHYRACILADFGRLDEAVLSRKQAIALAPTYVPAHLRLGDILLKQNQSTAAGKAYEDALRLDPNNAYALLGLARCAIRRDNWERARELLAAGISAHPEFVGGLSLMVTVSERLNDPATAAACRQAIGRREFVDVPDPWADQVMISCYDAYRLSVAAAVASAAGDHRLARTRLERAIELAPAAGNYHRQLANLLTQAGDPGAARGHLERAVELDPKDATSWLYLVQNLVAAGEMMQASRVLQAGLNTCPESPSLHLERAQQLKAAGQLDGALAEFRESYRLRPSESAPLVEMAAIHFSAGRPEEAASLLHEALEKQPEQPIALAMLALIAISADDEPAARAWWSRVRRQSSTPAPIANAIRQAYQQRFARPLGD